jgi:DNA-binding CsgD family transcriptional regulator
VDALSDREFRVFRLMGQGHATKEIAQAMGISTKTVDTHRENMKWKLGCGNGTELLLRARDWVRDHRDGS